MKSETTSPRNNTAARVAPLGKPKAFARKIPKTDIRQEKIKLYKKVWRIVLAKRKAKKPGTRSKVSTKIVPASLTLVTIKNAMIRKKR
jgi:hypothetical protein